MLGHDLDPRISDARRQVQLPYSLARDLCRRGLLLRRRDGLQLLHHSLNVWYAQHRSLDPTPLGGIFYRACQHDHAVKRVDTNL